MTDNIIPLPVNKYNVTVEFLDNSILLHTMRAASTKQVKERMKKIYPYYRYITVHTLEE